MVELLIDLFAEHFRYLPKSLLYVTGVPAIGLCCLIFKIMIWVLSVFFPTKLAEIMEIKKKQMNLGPNEGSESPDINWPLFKALLSQLFNDVTTRTAFIGSTAPNPVLYEYHTNLPCSLLDYEKVNRPLVLSFGSCS